MNKEKKIAIIHSTPIIGYAIKQLLNEYFDLSQGFIFSSFEEMKDYPNMENCYMYIADPDILINNYEFFILRKQKTVLTSNTDNTHSQFYIVNIRNHTDNIIESFQNIISAIDESNSKETGKEPLSIREIDVLKLVTKGKINKEIADELCISLHTVLSHRKNITSKLGIKTVSGLTFYAMMNGYIEDDIF